MSEVGMGEEAVAEDPEQPDRLILGEGRDETVIKGKYYTPPVGKPVRNLPAEIRLSEHLGEIEEGNIVFKIGGATKGEWVSTIVCSERVGSGEKPKIRAFFDTNHLPVIFTVMRWKDIRASGKK